MEFVRRIVGKMADEEGLVEDTEDFAVDAVEEPEELDAAAAAEEAARAAIPDPLESLYKFHPESILDYSETITPKIPLRVAPPGSEELDAYHRSQPFLSGFEKTKILGFRANQLSQGARPYIDVPEYVTSELEIARIELEQRRLPFILKRPMPDGTFEYWRLADLLILKE
jgi:DNA-directed RNA polymerase I, II, and III subunit RPABC2